MVGYLFLELNSVGLLERCPDKGFECRLNNIGWIYTEDGKVDLLTWQFVALNIEKEWNLRDLTFIRNSLPTGMCECKSRIVIVTKTSYITIDISSVI